MSQLIFNRTLTPLKLQRPYRVFIHCNMSSSNDAPKAKKLPKAPSAHPSYSVMVFEAITAMKNRTGSSRKSIHQYIFANYEVDAAKAGPFVNKALKKGVEKGSLQMAAEVGKKNAGKYKLVKVEMPKKKAAPEKKPVAKKAKMPGAKKVKTPGSKTDSKKKSAAKKQNAAKKSAKPAKKAAKPAKKAAKPTKKATAKKA